MPNFGLQMTVAALRMQQHSLKQHCHMWTIGCDLAALVGFCWLEEKQATEMTTRKPLCLGMPYTTNQEVWVLVGTIPGFRHTIKQESS